MGSQIAIFGEISMDELLGKGPRKSLAEHLYGVSAFDYGSIEKWKPGPLSSYTEPSRFLGILKPHPCFLAK